MNNINPRGLSVIPQIIETRPQNLTSIDIYSRLLDNRIVYLGGEIDAESANAIQAQLLYLTATDPHSPIELYINSPGGAVTDGLAIYDTIHYISAPVHAVASGEVCSMASILLAGCEKGFRCSLPHARIMIHQVSGGTAGTASDISIYINEVNRMKDQMIEMLATDTGQDKDKVRKDMERDHWMTAEEALDYGIVDKIL